MKKPRTSEELAVAWKQGKIDLNTALRRHLQNIEVWPVDAGFFMFLPILLGYANAGMIDKLIPVGEEGHTVAQVIEDLQLQPFLNNSEETL